MDQHIVSLSYFVAIQAVHASGRRFQLALQLVPLKASVLKTKKPRGKFPNCHKLIIYWPNITYPSKAEKHYKERDLTKLKRFPLFHKHVNDASTEIIGSSVQKLEKDINRYTRADPRTCPLERGVP